MLALRGGGVIELTGHGVPVVRVVFVLWLGACGVDGDGSGGSHCCGLYSIRLLVALVFLLRAGSTFARIVVCPAL